MEQKAHPGGHEPVNTNIQCMCESIHTAELLCISYRVGSVTMH